MKDFLLLTLLVPLIGFSQFVNFNVNDGLLNNGTTCFTTDLSGNLWIGTNQGPVKKISNNFIGYNMDNVTDMETDLYGNMWIATNNGVHVFDGVSWTIYQNGLYVKDILVANNGDVWLASSSGIYVYNGFTFYQITTNEGLPSNNVKSLAKNDDGTIWVATSAGLCKYVNQEFTVYTTNDGLSSNYIKAVYANNNRVYAYTAQGLNIYDGNNFSLITNVSLYSTAIKNITGDNNGNIWLSFPDCITKLHNDSLIFILTIDNTNLPDDNYGKIYVKDTLLYVSTSENGYYVAGNVSENDNLYGILDVNNIKALVT